MNTKKLSILFLCGWYPSRVLPNNGDFIQRHAEAVSLLHDVSVLHIISDASLKKNIEVVTQKVNGVQTNIAYLKPSKNPVVKTYRFLKAFFTLLSKIEKIDFVHVNKLYPFGLFALFLKWFRKKSFLISEHWTGYHQPLSKNISKTEIFLSKIISKNASFICPVSKDLQKSMSMLNFKGNYNVVPNVVDTNLFIPKENTSSKFTILHISNMLEEHKNVSGIITAFSSFKKQITNTELILIGENSKKYKSQTDALKISNSIQFIDHIPHYKVITYLQKSSVFVLFSNYENLPCVILESFSCGTPVISTNVGGISEFFPKDFGYLISPKNENELVEKLLDMYTNPIKNKTKMHEYAKANFSYLQVATTFSNLYFKIVH